MKYFRLLKWLLPLLLVPVVGLIFLLTTTTGLRLLAAGGDRLAGSYFSVEHVTGRFLNNWQLEKVQIHIDGVVDITLDELSSTWNPAALFQGRLDVDQLAARGLVIQQLESGDDTPVVLPEIYFPLDLDIRDMRVQDLTYHFSDDPEPFSINTCTLKASVHADQADITQLVLDAPGYGGELQGRVRFSKSWPLSLNGSWQVDDPGIGDFEGQMEAKGDLASLAAVVTFTIPTAARVQGTVTDILNDLHWQATGATDHFSLADIKVDQPVDGTLTVSRAFGTTTTYGGTLSADIHFAGYPQIKAHAEVEGDYDGLTISKLSFLLNEEQLLTRGKISWLNGFSWQGQVEGKQLDPGRLAAQWPGKIDASISTSGHWTAEDLTARIKIDQLQGDLRGFPLTGSGSAEIAGSEISLADLDLQSGSSFFQGNGRIGDILELRFKAASDDLIDLLPESKGHFALEGRLSGSRAKPVLALNLQGEDLAFQDYAAGKVTAEVHADLTRQGRVEADIKAEDIRVAGERISRAVLQINGTPEQHTLNLHVDSSPGRLQLALAGGLQEKQWQGSLSTLRLQTDQYGTWTMKNPVSLQLAEGACKLAELTLSRRKSQIAVAGKWQPTGWDLQGSAEQFSLRLFTQWGLMSHPVDGMLAASLVASGQGTMPDKVELSLAIPDIALEVEDEEGAQSTLHWTENTMNVQLANSKAQLTARSRFQDGSTADFEAESVGFDFRKPETTPLSGRCNVNIKDISPLNQLSGYLLSGTGKFGGSFVIDGTLGAPVFQGTMALADGEIQIEDVGITLEELELSAAGDGTANRVALTLVSEGSRLTADGLISLNQEQEWQADLSIQGKNFQAVDLPEYKVFISPDLQLQYGKDGASLRGTVTIPRADITPEEFADSVSSSRDVVVKDAGDKPQHKNLPPALDVNLVMGPEVKVAVHGVHGYLDGRLKIQQDPGRNMTGMGSLSLREGTFTFRGTTLEIRRGLVFYQGGSLDDPGLDVRAEKKGDDKEVGVQLTGSVSAMEMKLFSSPTMNDSDILSYLVVGRDMSQSDDAEGSMLGTAAAFIGRGTGNSLLGRIQKKTGLNVSLAGGEKATDVSLVVGKKISQDLYISYGKGLTDSEGVFKARYKMKHGFSIQTETTSEAAGADLYWSLER